MKKISVCLLCTFILLFLAWLFWHGINTNEILPISVDKLAQANAFESQGTTNALSQKAKSVIQKTVSKTETNNFPRPLAWNESAPHHVRNAIQNGAMGRVTFHVCDSAGIPVRDAVVFIGFYLNDKEGNTVEGSTDENGCFTAEKLCSLDANCRFTKEGYYRTNFRYPFHKAYTDCVRDGRWIPWNPTVIVTLKERRNPIPMYQKYIECAMPAGTNRLGFDFLVGDWVPPHGKGMLADMWYVYDENWIDRDNFYINLSFVFAGENNGCYIRKMDTFSDFVSEHQATDSEFRQSMISVIEQEKGKYTKEIRFAEDDYMVFRIRTKVDEQGKIVSSQYGKIYGPVSVPHRWSKLFSFTYYLNPNPNDPNLEYDPQKNLVLPQQQHTRNRNLP